MSSVKFLAALVSNLSIFDGAGYDLMGHYAINFLQSSANGSNMQSDVAHYGAKIAKLVGDCNWLTQDAQNRAQTYSNLIQEWLRSPVREDIEARIIAFNQP